MRGIGSGSDGVCSTILEPASASTLIHGCWVAIPPSSTGNIHTMSKRESERECV